MPQSALLEYYVKLKDEPSAKTKAMLTGKICEEFTGGSFKASEREIIKDILDHLSQDVDKMIRQTLAESLKNSDDLPYETAMRLANDVEDGVSVPILEFSDVLDDNDLQEIIASTDAVNRLTSIARRKEVSEKISGCLVDVENDEVATVLLANKGAAISDKSMSKVVNIFKDSENVLAALVGRGNLKPELAEKMVSMVSDKLMEKLDDRFGTRLSVLEKKVDLAREEVTLNVVSGTMTRSETIEFVEGLHKRGKLTHSMVLHALCKADLDFFEIGMANLAGIPLPNASKLLYQGDSKAFDALLNASLMPATMRRATEIILKLMMDEIKKGEKNAHAISVNLIQKVIEYGYDKNIPNMQYFMTLIKGSPVRDVIETPLIENS